ncbi:metallophosphoesterase [Treponema sp. J25]|jgi:Icc-related predicted phosphoesterase|uniref:metallophosphoesterase n=1 Tax=Treponema sp. J25 TaxID=2094121 RepID=UPI00104D85C1|nr:metallophosphoesterase [Treponema sp. J25]TCW62267.1 metallophosphoesterase [Treponema sp. J25]
MKILCISDQIDPLIYSNSIRQRFGDIDLVVSAGDLPLEYLDFIVSSLNKPLLFVYGNHNLEGLSYYRPEYEDYFKLVQRRIADQTAAPQVGAIHIGSRIHREEGLIFMGLGGSLRYNNGPNQFTNRQMNWEIIKRIPHLLYNKLKYGRYLDILVTHAPPLGIHDRTDPCHRGFKAFLWFMRFFKPRYLIHGHIHLYDLSDIRCTRYYETLVVNAYSHYIIDISTPSEHSHE